MKSYSIQRSRIAYEVLNTEVIIVDFNTGNYFAIAHVAKQIWQFFEQRTPLATIARLLADHYKREIDEVSDDLQQFFVEVLENGLIELESDGECGPVDGILAGSEDWEYDAPKLQKFMDVQNLLLLDPIHEVTEVGWPAKSE